MISRHLFMNFYTIKTFRYLKQMLTIKKSMSTTITSDIFKVKRVPNVNLKSNSNFHIPSVNTVLNAIERVFRFSVQNLEFSSIWPQKYLIYKISKNPLKMESSKLPMSAVQSIPKKYWYFVKNIKLGLFY